MQVRHSAILLSAIIFLHVVLLQMAVTESKRLPAAPESGIIIPAPVLTITSLEFKGFVSDLLFIKALIFKGSTYERKEEPRIKPEEWQWLNKVLMASTDLDPYFFDPYYLANAHMTWEAGMVRETNALLDKGTRYRDWDWVLPFFAGFNNFFFLHENMKAAELLTTASRRPGPSEQLLSLAARLAYTDKKTENAITFLEAILNKTEDTELRKQYMTRIQALQARLLLERGVSSYKKKFGKYPIVLQDLIQSRIIPEIPLDPYGGKFSLDTQGQVTNTKDYQLMIGQRRDTPKSQ
jgi:hypothetical protein